MRTNKIILLNFLIIILLFGCVEAGSGIQKNKQHALKENFSEREFKEAIIGKWQSVWKYTDRENIDYLEFGQNMEAHLIIEENGYLKEIKGNYIISFIRPPSESSITLANITIRTSNGSILLSHANFGFHNSLPTDMGFFLRIDSEPFGVLKKNDN